jgi:hypothetical protein
MHYQSNPQLEFAFCFLQYTNQNIFLTGKAGAGKDSVSCFKMKVDYSNSFSLCSASFIEVKPLFA